MISLVIETVSDTFTIRFLFVCDVQKRICDEIAQQRAGKNLMHVHLCASINTCFGLPGRGARQKHWVHPEIHNFTTPTRFLPIGILESVYFATFNY